MTIEQVVKFMYEEQMICIQDEADEMDVFYIGTLEDLEIYHSELLDEKIIAMYTERYKAFNNVSGLTIVI